jgi:Holliday junction DNA helicase RuvA
MIERLEGIIQAVDEQKVVVSCGPISLCIYHPQGHNKATGSRLSLHIYLAWNQENGPTLYGFDTQLDKTVFSMIIGCSGIGPKIGLAILNKLGAEGFLAAIQSASQDALSSVSGIGAKKAEQIMVSCKHKVQKLIASGVELTASSQLSHWYDVDQALTSLHYSKPEITRALDYLRSEYAQTENHSFDYLLRKALSYLALKQ